MKKIYVGIDISKEKCNLCYRSGLEIVREEECPNDVKGLKKAFKAALKMLGASFEDALVCAEYTGRYIYRSWASSSGWMTPPASRTLWASPVGKTM